MPNRSYLPPNALEFQQSITEELSIIKNRVRHLIGDRHWGEDGRFKEAILKNVIKRFLPANLSIGTGFVVDSNNQNNISGQLDIVVYDNTYPLLFSEGDFIITTCTNVKAIIEVKSNIRQNELQSVICRFEQSLEQIYSSLLRQCLSPRFSRAGRNREDHSRHNIFLGVFAYGFEGTHDSAHIRDSLRRSSGYANHVCLGENLFIRKWRRNDGLRLDTPVIAGNDFYNLYSINSLAFSYFISNLVHIVSGGLNDRSWFSFPIEGTKEAYRLDTVELMN